MSQGSKEMAERMAGVSAIPQPSDTAAAMDQESFLDGFGSWHRTRSFKVIDGVRYERWSRDLMESQWRVEVTD